MSRLTGAGASAEILKLSCPSTPRRREPVRQALGPCPNRGLSCVANSRVSQSLSKAESRKLPTKHRVDTSLPPDRRRPKRYSTEPRCMVFQALALA